MGIFPVPRLIILGTYLTPESPACDWTRRRRWRATSAFAEKRAQWIPKQTASVYDVSPWTVQCIFVCEYRRMNVCLCIYIHIYIYTVYTYMWNYIYMLYIYIYISKLTIAYVMNLRQFHVHVHVHCTCLICKYGLGALSLVVKSPLTATKRQHSHMNPLPKELSGFGAELF